MGTLHLPPPPGVGLAARGDWAAHVDNVSHFYVHALQDNYDVCDLLHRDSGLLDFDALSWWLVLYDFSMPVPFGPRGVAWTELYLAHDQLLHRLVARLRGCALAAGPTIAAQGLVLSQYPVEMGCIATILRLYQHVIALDRHGGEVRSTVDDFWSSAAFVSAVSDAALLNPTAAAEWGKHTQSLWETLDAMLPPSNSDLMPFDPASSFWSRDNG